MCIVLGRAFLAATVKRWVRDERAASLVEYGLLLALIAVVVFAAVVFIGGSTEDSLSSTGSRLDPL